MSTRRGVSGGRRSWLVSYYLDAFRRVELIAACRYGNYEFQPGQKLEDLNFSGPAVGMALRW